MKNGCKVNYIYISAVRTRNFARIQIIEEHLILGHDYSNVMQVKIKKKKEEY